MIIYFLTVSLKPNGSLVNVSNMCVFHVFLIYVNPGDTIINDFTTTTTI